jgi:hypothetical protein
MKRFVVACTLAIGLGVLASAGQAQAQYGLPGMPQNPYVRPPISPYLNLNRGGNPAINYFGLVQPQLQTTEQLQMLQMQQTQMAQLGFGGTDPNAAAPGITASGHHANFFNYGHYFGPPGGGVRPAVPMAAGVPVRR